MGAPVSFFFGYPALTWVPVAQEDDSFVIGHRLLHVDDATPRLSILLSTENLLLNAWYERLDASLTACIDPGA